MSFRSLSPGQATSISLVQFVLIIHGVQVGIGLVTLPSDIAMISGYDGWIALLLGWLLTTLSSLMIVQVMKKYPNKTIVGLLSHFFGKWAGLLLAVIYGGYMLLFGYLVFYRMVLLIQSWVMQQTATYVLLLLFAIPAYVLMKGGIRSIGRFSEFSTLVSIGIPFMMLKPWADAHWIHLLPVLGDGWMPVLKAISGTFNAYLGFEITFFIYPFLDNKKAASLGVIIANAMTMVIYLFVTLLCYVTFSPNEIPHYRDVVLVLLKSVEFEFLERVDIVILTVYLFLIVRTWVPPLFVGLFYASKLIRFDNYKILASGVLLLMLLVTYMWDPGWHNSEKLVHTVAYIGISIGYVLPYVLWLLLIGRKPPAKESDA